MWHVAVHRATSNWIIIETFQVNTIQTKFLITYVIQWLKLVITCKNIRTYPLLLKCSIILQTESIGTEKPNPSASSTFIILMPITSPSTLTRGPPEFPYTKKNRKKRNSIKSISNKRWNYKHTWQPFPVHYQLNFKPSKTHTHMCIKLRRLEKLEIMT